MRVHVVKSEDTWILKRISHSIRIPGITVGLSADNTADINFYVSYQGFRQRSKGTLNVPWMTHLPSLTDDGGWRRARFFEATRLSDYCIAMSRKTAQDCPPSKTAIWGGAPDAAFVKKTLVLGIAAKMSRRKCPDKVSAMQKVSGVEVRVSGGNLSQSEMLVWFQELDYLVVTSDTEGGPYSVLEAVAAGVPIIAPDVGWCWEYPCIHYDGSIDGLLTVIRSLRFPEDPWSVASAELQTIFESMNCGRFIPYGC